MTSAPDIPPRRHPFRRLLRLAVLALSAFPAATSTAQSPAASAPTVEVTDTAPMDLVRLALRSTDEERGDYDQLAQSWLQALPRGAGHLQTELLARRLASVGSFLRDPRQLRPLAERALEVEYANPLTPLLLRDTLAQLYAREGQPEKAASLEQSPDLLTDWLILGPFGKADSAHFRRRYAPEGNQDLDRVYRDRWQELRWRAISLPPGEPMVKPFSWLYPRRGVAYCIHQIHSDVERDAVLYRNTVALQAWLNGKVVIRDDPNRAYLPSRQATTIRLAKGWNRLLVKTASPFWMRLLDSSGKPFVSGTLRHESERALHPATAATERVGDATPLATLSRWEAWTESVRLSGDPTYELSLALLSLAMIRLQYDVGPNAVALVEEILAPLEKDAFLHYGVAQIYADAAYLPESLAKNRRKAALEKTVALNADFAPAYAELASLLEDDEQYRDAVATVEKGLERSPENLRGLLGLRSIYAKAGWEAEELDVIRRLDQVAPNSTRVPEYWAEFYQRRGNAERVDAYYTAILERDARRTDIVTRRARLAQRRGDIAHAEELFRRNLERSPQSRSARSALMEFLVELERYDGECLEIARGLCDKQPQNPRPWVRLGEILELAGDSAGAKSSYQKALELEPGLLRLRRYLEETDGNAPAGDHFWEPFDESLEEWLPRLPETGPLVENASSILVLDISVSRVLPDGSWSEYTHQAQKILTEASKEDLARVNARGEIIKLRTLTAEGESLEPVPAEGRQSYVMPGLAPGAFVEFAYRGDRSSLAGRRLALPRFYFQDAQFKQSFLLSRQVVILPSDLDPSIAFVAPGADERERGLVEVKHWKKELEDGTTAYIYEARDAPRLEPERGMPQTEEYLPHVVFTEPSDWSAIAADLGERYTAYTRVSPELLDRVAGIAAGAPKWERVEAMYDFVREAIPKEGGTFDATRTLLEQSGNRTILFKALLNAADIPSDWAFLRPPEDMLPRANWNLPETSFFPYPYVAVVDDHGERRYVSLSQRTTPCARLPEYLSGGRALRLTAGGYRMEHLPAVHPGKSAQGFDATIELLADKKATATVRWSAEVSSAFGQKDQFRTLQGFQKTSVLQRFANGLFPGCSLKDGGFGGLETDEPFAIELNVETSNFLQKRADEYHAKAVLNPSRLVARFAGRRERVHPFHLRTHRVDRDRIRVKLGHHALLRRPPDVAFATALGTYSLSYTLDDGDLVVERALTLLPGRLEPEEYDAFVSFCERVDAAEQQTIALR